jgi:aminoglycoside 2''-phosphotransferase
MNADGGSEQETALRAAFPGLAPDAVRFLSRGQYADALLVNDALVCRFPRSADGVAALAREHAVLMGIRGRLPLETPEPIQLHLGGAQPGEAFLAYRLIPGEGLWHETLGAIQDETVLDRLAGQLGGFLYALHTLPPEVIDFPLEPADTRAHIIAAYGRVREKLFPFMRPAAREWAVQHWETFLDTPRHFAYRPALRHSDFGTGNLVYDPEAQTLRGVLDWQWAGPGDPATDIAGLLGYGERFVRRLAATYPGLDALWERVLFWHGTYALEEALYGIESGDAEAFEAGIRSFR